MADSNRAIDHVLEVEGGYVHHLRDPGGATNYGITQGTFNIWLRTNGTDPYSVQHLTKFQAREIYRTNYWYPMNLQHIKFQNVASCIMDQAVNQGTVTAGKRAQRSVNYLYPRLGPALKVDGVIGPKSIKRINSMLNSRIFCVDFTQRSQIFYADLVRRNPDMAVFLVGWIRRTHQLLKVSVSEAD